MRWPGLAIVAVAGTAFGWAEEPPGAGAPKPESSCVTCHAQLDGAALEPTKHLAEDVHFQKGLSCHDCHGGNPAAGADDPGLAHDEKKGWTGKPKRVQVPLLCARCHADASFMKRFNPQMRVDQLSEYRTSVHGKRNAAGDAKAAVCVDCHGVHPIRTVKDPRSGVYPTQVAETCGRCHNNVELMRGYSIPANQYAGYKTSVHAKALYDKGDTAAPTCNDCHGSHGAAPPGVQSVVQVCGSCHSREATLFREVEVRKHLNLTPCIQCMICHDNHAVQAPTDDMIGVGPKSTCLSCHRSGDPAYRAIEEMSASLQRLKAGLDEAKGLLGRAERAGVEVAPDRVALRKAQDQLVEARVLAHSFDRELFLKATETGLSSTDAGVAAAQRAFRELRQRRLGLAVSLVVIAGVIVALALKVREIERDGEP